MDLVRRRRAEWERWYGPVSAARTRRWLEDGGFDVVHIHEPVSPSLSLLALWAAVTFLRPYCSA